MLLRDAICKLLADLCRISKPVIHDAAAAAAAAVANQSFYSRVTQLIYYVIDVRDTS